MVIGKPIMVVCKNCKRPAKSDEFVLDPVIRMMVCPNCVKERRLKDKILKKMPSSQVETFEKSKDNKPKPAGWDQDDEYLEKLSNRKKETEPQVRVEVIDSDRVKYTCPRCQYEFTFNKPRWSPSNCPYCGLEVMMK